MSELLLIVNGKRYGGWKSVRVTRSIESLAGSFDLDVSDRWANQDVPWPIAEEDACRIEIDGIVVIDGFVTRRSFSLSGNSRTLGYSGRDRSAELVENSALLDKWTFHGASVLDVARKVAEPFGIEVSLQPGLVLPKARRKQVVDPGSSPYEAMHHAATEAGVLLVGDGAGGVLITRSGSGRAAVPLVQGQNVLGATIDYDASERFHRYVVATQTSGAEWLNNVDAAVQATKIHAEAIDQGVRRRDRVLVIRPEHGMTAAYARQRADWEARIRAAKAETASITVQGWQQSRDGGLWPLNALVGAHVPAIGINGDMLISQVEHSLGDSGEMTHLRLVRPDAFTPEPKAVVGGTGLWKEIAGGVKI